MTAEPAPARLGTREAHVMEILWDHGPSTIREIITWCESDPAYTTIATVLGHLQDKGYVRRAKEGHQARFVPTFSREEHAAALMNAALSSGGDRTASILRFVDGMAESDKALLREYLARHEGST